MFMRPIVLTLLVAAAAGAFVTQAQRPAGGPGAVDLDTVPFRGVTTDGQVVAGLFTVRRTGISTRPVMEAAVRFLESLSPEQRSATTFAVNDHEWRRWNNVHRAARSGVAFKDLNETQTARALELLKSALSAKGLEQAQNVMRLNHTIAELTNNFTEYGEGLYHLTVMGEPSPTEPWGWQLEGHHLILNYFVLGDQIVMTPAFLGSEPVTATSGKYAGTSVLQAEQAKGLALMRALTPEQQKQALIDPGPKTGNNAQGQAYRDNLQLPYAGIQASHLSATQRALLLAVIAEYVNAMPEGHAKVRMEDVRAHLTATHFGWIGETADDSVFYYRVHSPVILIEFDHQLPVALKGPRVPGRQHIHAVVRTPNGNDYGKDLLRQHYLEHRHDAGHGHVSRRW
jgi:hypothetical protein